MISELLHGLRELIAEKKIFATPHKCLFLKICRLNERVLLAIATGNCDTHQTALGASWSQHTLTSTISLIHRTIAMNLVI